MCITGAKVQRWASDIIPVKLSIYLYTNLFYVAEKFSVVQKEVSDLLQGRVLVGHALRNDLKVHTCT